MEESQKSKFSSLVIRKKMLARVPLALFVGVVFVFFCNGTFGQSCQHANWRSHNLTQVTSGPTIWSEMVVEQQPNNRYDLIGRTGNRLSHYWWTNATPWKGEDLTTIANSNTGGHSITGNPSFRQNFQRGVGLRHDVFAGNPFDLIHYWWAGNGWRSENLTQQLGNGHRILGDPIFLPGEQNHPHNPLRHDVFAMNGSSELVHYWWISGARWANENLTRDLGGPAIRSLSPTAVSFDRGNRLGYQIHVFGRGGRNNDHLIHYWWHTRAGWDAEDLTMQTGGPLITSDPEANYQIGERLEVLATDINGHIIRYWSFGTNVWHHDNLTSSQGGDPIVGKPVVLNSIQRPTIGIAYCREDIWGRTSNHDLVHYWSLDNYHQCFGTQTWQQPENLTTGMMSVPPPDYGDPAAIKEGGIANLRYEVFGRMDSDLISSCWTAASGWNSDNLTSRPTTMDTIESDPVVTEDGRHVFARNGDGEVIHYWHDNNETGSGETASGLEGIFKESKGLDSEALIMAAPPKPIPDEPDEPRDLPKIDFGEDPCGLAAQALYNQARADGASDLQAHVEARKFADSCRDEMPDLGDDACAEQARQLFASNFAFTGDAEASAEMAWRNAEVCRALEPVLDEANVPIPSPVE